MSASQALQKVQVLDVEIKALERQLRDIPARKKAEQTRLDQNSAALHQSQEAVKHRQAELKRIELEQQAHEEKIQKLRQQQLQLKTNKEFKAMDSEIATIKQQIKELEDSELVVMEQIDAAKADVGAQKSELDRASDGVRADTDVLDARMTEINARLTALRETRAEAVKGVPADWLKVYTTIATRRDRALVPIDGEVCGGCHMKLPPFIINDTKKRGMVTCTFCGRLLH